MRAEFVTMLLVLLLPLIPAFVLFWLLPHLTGEGSGPFMGMQLKVGGAFGGYFVAALLFWQISSQPLDKFHHSYSGQSMIYQESAYGGTE
jgi:hypothetical protein